MAEDDVFFGQKSVSSDWSKSLVGVLWPFCWGEICSLGVTAWMGEGSLGLDLREGFWGSVRNKEWLINYWHMENTTIMFGRVT